MDKKFVIFYEYEDSYIIGTINGNVESITKLEYKKLKEQNLESSELKFVDLSKYQNKTGGVSLIELDTETYNSALKLKSQKQVSRFEIVDTNRNEHWLICSFDENAKLWILWIKLIFLKNQT